MEKYGPMYYLIRMLELSPCPCRVCRRGQYEEPTINKNAMFQHGGELAEYWLCEEAPDVPGQTNYCPASHQSANNIVSGNSLSQRVLHIILPTICSIPTVILPQQQFPKSHQPLWTKFSVSFTNTIADSAAESRLQIAFKRLRHTRSSVTDILM
ncbi:hypothetical protein J6590_035471 [Homalodisca vitripennis]|nr:hypothetical protein J6590_035471 [Homalodisca vitripennis]